MPFIRINGLVEVDEDVTHDDFMDQFLAWLEEQGWDFEGKSNFVSDEEGENP